MNESRQLLNLGRRGVCSIHEAGAVQLTVTRGSVWVTLDDDPRDIVLEAGESFAVPARRRAVVYAFTISTVAVQPIDAAQPLAHRPSQRPRTTAQVAV